jgi:hypothetical protein
VTVPEILEIVGERGLAVSLSHVGQPVLTGPPEERTPALLDVLRLHRTEIVEHLLATRPKCREFLWRTGHRDTEDPRDAHFGTYYPAGAWWWRVQGDTQWRAVPGRGGEREPVPENAP